MRKTKLNKVGKQPISKIQRHSCKECNKIFTYYFYKSYEKSKHKGIFCSSNCYNIHKRKNAFNFPCKICGVAIYTQPAQLKYRARSTCSKGCRSILARVLAEKRRVEEGYTKHQLDRLARYSPEAQNWRISVFKRDNYTCQLCEVRGAYLEADHIKPWAYFPELRYELSNGRTLCKKCHNLTKIGYKKMREIYEKK